ncbi:MAG: DUF6607 family protein [Parvularculaceae bacterium]
MTMLNVSARLALAAAGALWLGACQTTAYQSVGAAADAASQEAEAAKFEQDRKAILAMTGNYRVKFDFQETVPFVEGYTPKDRNISGGHEVVRVIEDDGRFISLQHLLVAGGEEKVVIKHWRQDWTYEPSSVLVYAGGAAWKKRAVSPDEAKGKWSQVVYQVDDAPRYGALAAWSHDDGVSQWTAPREWRPLPRRDATKRDDYDVVDAINRHAIMPNGWVHEQDNSKLRLGAHPQILVREIGVNTYVRDDEFDATPADEYWEATKDYWAGVRAIWSKMEAENASFGLTIQGEPADLYNPLLELAEKVREGEEPAASADVEAGAVIAKFTTTHPAPLNERIARVE